MKDRRNPLNIAWKAWRDERGGPAAIAARQQARLVELVEFARKCSPYYRSLYAGLPPHVSDVRTLPPVTKPELMENFDGWVTDPAVTRSGVEEFVADESLVGESYLGKYMVWTTSGTTGEPAILIHDWGSWRVMELLPRFRGYRGFLKPRDFFKIVQGGARSAAIIVTGGHFGGNVAVEQVRRQSPRMAERVRVFSALTPLDELVEELNAFQPVVLGGYASALALLAREQEAGRLRIRPVLVSTSGEMLAPAVRAQIESTFECRMPESYGASEVGAIALACGHGWMHVQSDWVILEPVDEDYKPVPPGEPSSTVLVTGLANRVQPIIRYDLGDSVTVKPEACTCGRPLLAIRVVGRTNDILSFESDDGKEVQLLPLSLGTVIEETEGVRRFQAIQTGPATLGVRLEPVPGADGEKVWEAVAGRLDEFLEDQGLLTVEIQKDPEPPKPNPKSGKLRQVWSAL
ncbi:MAG: hypothetical protein WA982_15455 [Rubrobacteraceae bacterium]